jgi:tripartite-type tricarboxylate transporter receptor subunit TctC
MRIAIPLTCVLAALVSGGPAWGAFPEKTVRVIVPSPPGGGNDVMARLAGQKLAEA